MRCGRGDTAFWDWRQGMNLWDMLAVGMDAKFLRCMVKVHEHRAHRNYYEPDIGITSGQYGHGSKANWLFTKTTKITAE